MRWLIYKPYHPKTNVFLAFRRQVAAPKSHLAEGGGGAVVAATDDAVGGRRRAEGIYYTIRVAILVIIPAPLPHITIHVVKAVAVWLSCHYLVRLVTIVPCIGS